MGVGLLGFPRGLPSLLVFTYPLHVPTGEIPRGTIKDMLSC
jgi:hypothetical protein